MLITKKHLKALSISIPNQAAGEVFLCITGKNLVKKDYCKGYLRNGVEERFFKNSPDHLTTKWFPIDSAGKWLVVSGDAYNRAVWQFGLKDGSVRTEIPTYKKYRLKASKLFGRTFPKVRIPEDAIKARVYFSYRSDEETMPPGERLQVEYGLIPTAFEACEKEMIPLPELAGKEITAGKKWKILYFNRAWYLIDEKEVLTEDTDFDALLQQEDTKILKSGCKALDLGCSVFLLERHPEGMEAHFAEKMLDVPEELQGMRVICEEASEAIFSKEPPEARNLRGIYGVRHSLEDSVPVCERTFDAAGLHFNYMLESDMASPYENDFDHIAPWCAMRRCAVSFCDGIRRIIYEGEPGYCTDGTAGEIMVEIPKHYVRREVRDGYEEVAISAGPQEGFVLDPSFLTREGEQEAIYVGAYFSSEIKQDGKRMLGSRKDQQVSIFHSADKFLQMTEANQGFQEVDLCAVLTIQRLFMVESAMLDSKSVFEGNIYMPYLISDKTSTYYSMDTVEQTNTIRLRDNSISRRFLPGNAVAVMRRWKDYDTEEYANIDRVVTGREFCDDGTVKISFSGKPVNLVAQETGLSGLPERTGGPDRIPYHTGAGTESYPEIGHDAFKYRWIENVWGGIWVLLGGCSVQDSRLTVEYPDGRVAEISYPLPEQNVELTSKQFGAPQEMCVRRLGYDPANPLIALPEEIGGGAGTCSWYCDAWYSVAKPGEKYIVTYGGAWDNMGFAGIFAFRAAFHSKKRVTFNGARLLNVKQEVLFRK